MDNIHVVSLKSVYPQGAEKVMIYHSTGRIVEEGEIPADKGVIVLNISTVSHLYRFIKTGMPLTHKRLTIDGNYVDKPMNVRVPIGTSIDYVLDFAGVDKSKADKILMGGPMMGIAIYDVETPVIKNNNAILVLQEKDRKYKASRQRPRQHGSGQGTCPPHHRLYPLRKMRLCLPGEPDAGGAGKSLR